MSIQANFPNLKPSLLLDFANTKKLDPRITFTRASNATYYDGKTVAKAEENLFTYSSDMSSGWTTGNTTLTVNSATAPDGTSTAATLAGSTSSSVAKVAYRSMSSFITGNALSSYTYSLYAKAGTHTFLQVCSNLSGFGQFNVNLSTGATAAIGNISGSATSVGNGWYRIVVNTLYGYTGGGALDVYLVDSLASTEGAPSTTTGNVYLWGFQVEQRSSATAYTATTANPITNYIPVMQTAGNNVARFDHNPTTGESLGLLIEEQRTNLVTNSSAPSSYTRTASMGVGVAPDGTISAQKVAPTATNDYHLVNFGSYTTVASTPYTQSFYAKYAGNRYAYVEFSPAFTGTTWKAATFDLLNGVVSSVSTSGGATITPVGNGWYRCAVTQTAASSGVTWYLGIYTDAGGSVLGDPSQAMYVWGAQIEAGAFATSYIATAGSQVTRSTDDAAFTGANFSSWYNSSEGTFFLNTARLRSTGYGYIMADLNNTNTAALCAYISNPNWSLLQENVTVNGPNLGVAYNTTTEDKVAYSYTVGGRAVSITARNYVPSTLSRAVAPLTRASIAYQACLTIKKLAYYPARVTDAQLQALTS